MQKSYKKRWVVAAVLAIFASSGCTAAKNVPADPGPVVQSNETSTAEIERCAVPEVTVHERVAERRFVRVLRISDSGKKQELLVDKPIKVELKVPSNDWAHDNELQTALETALADPITGSFETEEQFTEFIKPAKQDGPVLIYASAERAISDFSLDCSGSAPVEGLLKSWNSPVFGISECSTDKIKKDQPETAEEAATQYCGN